MSTSYKTDELYAAYKAPILRYLKWKLRNVLSETGDDAIAEDISSELWLRVLKHEGQFENKGSVKSWLYTIADNLVKDFWRDTLIRYVDRYGDTRTRPRMDRLDYPPKTSGEDPEDGKDSPASNLPDARMEAWLSGLEETDAADVILRQVDPPFRVVLKLRLQGFTLDEIAEKTNMPLSAVKARFYRGKARLLEMRETPIRCGSIECRPEKWVFTW